jgi:hypothetical protein
MNPIALAIYFPRDAGGSQQRFDPRLRLRARGLTAVEVLGNRSGTNFDPRGYHLGGREIDCVLVESLDTTP